MCDDNGNHGFAPDTDRRWVVSRRAVLRAAASSAVPAGALGTLPWARPAAAAPIGGAYSMAMHIHASFSELRGSMDAHLQQARSTGVDVVWWTEHDTKMNGVNDKRVVHFTSLTDETGDGPPWQWERRTTGSLSTASTGGIVTGPASPLDPVPEGSLHVRAQSTGTAAAALGFEPARVPSHQTWRTNLTRQTLRLEVRPAATGANAYLELLISTSYHPASGGRTAGEYTLSYRVGGGAAPGSMQSRDRTGIVTVAASPGRWNSLTFQPQQDLAALFPDLDSRDFSLFALRLQAVSSGGAIAEGYLDYLRFTRQSTGEVALDVQGDMMTSYAGRYPGVTQRRGLEVSHRMPHVNWFGGAVALPTYDGTTRDTYTDFLRDTVIPDIHRAGGLASYNHPFGVGFQPALPASTQDDLVRQVATEMVANGACGTDILEVGYPVRSGVDIDHHVALWDVCSRNGMFLTGNGVTDDHDGSGWTARELDWTTQVWASGTSEARLLDALRAGRAWCGSLTRYRGALDLLVDGACPMGSVSVSRLRQRDLMLTATNVPAGGSVQVVRGLVDYAGPGAPTPARSVIATFTAAELRAGTVSLPVQTQQSCYLRSQVRDAGGALVGLSNPVWLLQEAPPAGIPAARAC